MSLPLSTIGTGAAANDTTGDTVRAAFTKVNDNFTTLNTAVSSLQSNAVTAATIVSLNLTGNLVAANVTANTNVYGNLVGGNVTGVNGSYSGNVTAGNVIGTHYGNVIGTIITLSSAIRFANLTTEQVSNIGSPASGMTVYNYTSGNIQVYNGTKWANITLS